MINVTKSYYKEKLTLTYLLTTIFILIVMDITFDFMEGLPLQDMIYDLMLEGTILCVVLFTANFVWKKFTTEKKTNVLMERDLEETKRLALIWEKKSTQFIKEFQAYVHTQFDTWNLSKSEKEIALLILNGKSSKEMASIRFTSERTIRNQSRSIYEKSGLSGKNEFSAFFLDELMKDFLL